MSDKEDQKKQEEQQHTSPFEAARQINEHGQEFWSARDLSKILGYTEWRNFHTVVIKRAKKACEENGQVVPDHFVRSYKMVPLGSGSQRKTEDILLSRYAAYLTVMNGDPNMPVVALGQTYFAVQTRRQELADQGELAGLNEDERRLLMRNQVIVQNRQLAETATQAGVVSAFDFAIFQDHGYMGGTELAANLFRITQTDESIKRKGIREKQQANAEHHRMGTQVREFMLQESGTAPEDLPTPQKSIQQLQREAQKRLTESEQQPPLFDNLSEDL